MAKVTIYRVTRGGKGLYMSGLWYDAIGEKFGDKEQTNTTERQPSPYVDKVLCNTIVADEMHYGFASKRQLRRWIYRKAWRESIHEHGGVVEVWQVPREHTMRGHAQAVFNLEQAQLVYKLPILQI